MTTRYPELNESLKYSTAAFMDHLPLGVGAIAVLLLVLVVVGVGIWLGLGRYPQRAAPGAQVVAGTTASPSLAHVRP